jgi:hypothetical protein
VIVLLFAGCAGTEIQSAYFGPSAAIKRAIVRYHEQHASEGGARCFSPYIDGISQVRVLEDTPERLVVDVRYFWRDRVQDSGGGGIGQNCTGFSERTFTLQRTQSGGLAVVRMTGQQDEPAIRSLIRRALPS